MKTFLFGSSRRQEAQFKIGHRPSAIGNQFEPRHLGCHQILALLAGLLFAGNLFAADVAADFSAANELYAEGKFSDAADAYGKILQTGAQSPALLFNAGNAEFKAGHLGQAIAAYRRAAQLSPRDDEIRANLAFVRNQVQGATLRESRWQSWFGALTLNEGALLTAVLFWVTLALLVARQLRPALVPKLRTATRLFAIAGPFFRHPCWACRRRIIFGRPPPWWYPPRRPRAAGRLTMRRACSSSTTARSFPFWTGMTTGCKSPTARARPAG